MKRENWIKWDLDSRLGTKMAVFFAEHGAEGYGMFLLIIETLYREESHRMKLDPISIQNYTKLYKPIQTDTNGYINIFVSAGLLQSDGEYLWSDRVNDEIASNELHKNAVSDKRKQAISARWQKQRAIQTDTNGYKAIQTDTNGYKKHRGEEIRLDENRLDKNNSVNTILVESAERPLLTTSEPVSAPKPKRIRKPKKEEPPKTEVAEHIFLTDEQIQKLSAKMTPKEYRYWINNASAYASQNPRAFRQKYRNHFMMILQWRVRRIEDGRIWDEAKASYQMPPKPSFNNNQPREQARHVVPDAEATKKMLESLTK